MNRQEWLNSLQPGQHVMFHYKNKTPKELLIRLITEGHICMIDPETPKADLAYGEVVFQENGEGPFGERIEPLEQIHES